MTAFFSLCSRTHISLLEKPKCLEDAAAFDLFACSYKWKRVRWVFGFGLHMQNDSEYPMRRRSPLASAAVFIHKLCLSEVDLIERTAWLYNMTRAIHKWDAWSSGFWFTGTHSSLLWCVYVCHTESEAEKDGVCGCFTEKHCGGSLLSETMLQFLVK